MPQHTNHHPVRRCPCHDLPRIWTDKLEYCPYLTEDWITECACVHGDNHRGRNVVMIRAKAVIHANTHYWVQFEGCPREDNIWISEYDLDFKAMTIVNEFEEWIQLNGRSFPI